MRTIYYVDPQSYNNLALYDYNLLSNINDYSIIFWGNSKYPKENNCNHNISYKLLFKYSAKNKIFKYFSYMFSLIVLGYNIIRDKPHIVHVQWIKVWHLDVQLQVLCKLVGSKYIITAHNVVPHKYNNKYLFRYWLHYKMCTAIIVHDNNTKHIMVNNYKIEDVNVSVIPHGYLRYKYNEERVDILIKEYETLYKNNKIMIAMLGAQSKYKGTDIFVDTIAGYDNDDNIIWIIWGKNINIEYTKIIKKTNVIIKDEYISDEEFVAIMRCSDVIVLPYRTISQSGILMTAIAERTPVIVSKNGGLSDPIKYGNIGWVLTENTVRELDSTLNKVISNKEFVAIKNNILEWDKVEKQYSWENIALNTATLYDKVLNELVCL